MKDLDKMKRRIFDSYKYKEDLIRPLSEILDMEEERVTDLVIQSKDMLRLQGLHSRYDKRRKRMKKELLEIKVDMDLHLSLITDLLSIIKDKTAEEIKDELIEKVLVEGEEYEKALENAKEKIRKSLEEEK